MGARAPIVEAFTGFDLMRQVPLFKEQIMALYFESQERANEAAEDMSKYFIVELTFDGKVYTLTLKEI